MKVHRAWICFSPPASCPCCRRHGRQHTRPLAGRRGRPNRLNSGSTAAFCGKDRILAPICAAELLTLGNPPRTPARYRCQANRAPALAARTKRARCLSLTDAAHHGSGPRRVKAEATGSLILVAIRVVGEFRHGQVTFRSCVCQERFVISLMCASVVALPRRNASRKSSLPASVISTRPPHLMQRGGDLRVHSVRVTFRIVPQSRHFAMWYGRFSIGRPLLRVGVRISPAISLAEHGVSVAVRLTSHLCRSP